MQKTACKWVRSTVDRYEPFLERKVPRAGLTLPLVLPPGGPRMVTNTSSSLQNDELMNQRSSKFEEFLMNVCFFCEEFFLEKSENMIPR